MLPKGHGAEMSSRIFVAIAAGGAVGALLRAAVVEWLLDGQSIALLALNVIGSFILGAAVGRLAHSHSLRAGVGVGFCGALTSMSTFAVDVAQRFQAGRVVVPLVLALATIALATAGGYFGLRIGEHE